jgi:hypothetical protein
VFLLSSVGAELEVRRRKEPSGRLGLLFAFEHGSLALALLSGVALTLELGWGIGHARWFGLKLGLVAFLLLPLEGMHAYACHVLMGRGDGRLRERGVSIEQMVRTLEVVVLLPALALILWLSLAHPF